MAASTTNPKCRSLQTFPTELLLKITKYIPDFPSLNGLLTLLTAHNRGVSLVERFQTEIFANVIRAGRGHELSRIVTAVMTLRNHSPTRRMGLLKGIRQRWAEQEFIYEYLRSDDFERDGKPHYLQRFSDPVSTIRDIWSISQDIDALVQDFAEVRIIKPSQQPERPPSPTELYRIRRALWHFQLCYELVHPEEPVPSGAEDETPSQRSRRYVRYRTQQDENQWYPKPGWLYGHKRNRDPSYGILSTLPHHIYNLPCWLGEEINGVRFHLASLVNAFQYLGQGLAPRLSRQPELLQRLVKDLNHWRANREEPADHLLVAELRYERDPNLVDKEQWGWAMWDADRLSSRGLKPGFQPRHFYSEHLSDKAFQECEDSQSTYIDRWVAQKYIDDVRSAQEEKRLRYEQELRALKERWPLFRGR